MSDTWLILRCRPSDTLGLTADLIKSGLDAWSPRFLGWKRPPYARRPRSVMLPVLPSFVFVSEKDQRRLNFSLNRMITPIPFKTFVVNSHVVVVRDMELEALRNITAEKDVEPIAVSKEQEFRNGCIVQIKAGPFAGLKAVVESWDGTYYAIEIKGKSLRFKLPTFLLEQIAP